MSDTSSDTQGKPVQHAKPRTFSYKSNSETPKEVIDFIDENRAAGKPFREIIDKLTVAYLSTAASGTGDVILPADDKSSAIIDAIRKSDDDVSRRMMDEIRSLAMRHEEATVSGNKDILDAISSNTGDIMESISKRMQEQSDSIKELVQTEPAGDRECLDGIRELQKSIASLADEVSGLRADINTMSGHTDEQENADAYESMQREPAEDEDYAPYASVCANDVSDDADGQIQVDMPDDTTVAEDVEPNPIDMSDFMSDTDTQQLGADVETLPELTVTPRNDVDDTPDGAVDSILSELRSISDHIDANVSEMGASDVYGMEESASDDIDDQDDVSLSDDDSRFISSLFNNDDGTPMRQFGDIEENARQMSASPIFDGIGEDDETQEYGEIEFGDIELDDDDVATEQTEQMHLQTYRVDDGTANTGYVSQKKPISSHRANRPSLRVNIR